MANPKMTVLPGSPDVPQFVEIDCSGLDNAKTVQFLVNGQVRGTIPVVANGRAVLSYIVPPGQVRNALADFGHCEINADVTIGNTLARLSTGLGDSIELRYQV